MAAERRRAANLASATCTSIRRAASRLDSRRRRLLQAAPTTSKLHVLRSRGAYPHPHPCLALALALTLRAVKNRRSRRAALRAASAILSPPPSQDLDPHRRHHHHHHHHHHHTLGPFRARDLRRQPLARDARHLSAQYQRHVKKIVVPL